MSRICAHVRTALPFRSLISKLSTGPAYRKASTIFEAVMGPMPTPCSLERIARRRSGALSGSLVSPVTGSFDSSGARSRGLGPCQTTAGCLGERYAPSPASSALGRIRQYAPGCLAAGETSATSSAQPTGGGEGGSEGGGGILVRWSLNECGRGRQPLRQLHRAADSICSLCCPLSLLSTRSASQVLPFL